MGIPIWRPPPPDDPKSSVKSDPCALSRSSIRRRATVRPAETSTTARGRLPQIALLTSQIDGLLTESRIRRNVIQNEITSLSGGLGDLDSMSDSARREEGSRLLQDALQYRQPGQRLRIPRESSLRFEVPTPPWSPSDTPQRSFGGDYARIRQTESSFSPQVAHAYSIRLDHIAPTPETGRRSPLPAPRSERPLTQDEPAQYLRRVGHRSIGTNNNNNNNNNGSTASPRHGIDGLGDRDRSTSPYNNDLDELDHDLDNAWETLLTTLEPDLNLPSNDSSFTSTAAAQSDGTAETSGSGHGHPVQTQQQPSLTRPNETVHMLLEPYPDFFNPCDVPEHITDSDTEVEPEIDSHSSIRSRQPEISLQLIDRTSAVGATQDSQRPLPRMRIPGAVMRRVSFNSRIASSPGDMQAIIDRLAQRRHVPDEWWAAAGLSRTVGRQIDAGDPSTNFGNEASTSHTTNDS